MTSTHRPTYRARKAPARPSHAVTAVLAVALCLALAPAPWTTPAHAQVVIQPAPTHCIAIADPLPSGTLGRPAVGFTSYLDYNFVHSADHLQGNRAMEKFAAGLLWNPPSPVELSGFKSVVAVSNPDPALTANVKVEFYDQAGTMVGSTGLSIPPEGVRTVPASALSLGTPAGLGSARIVSSDVPILGETIHNTLSMNLVSFGGPVVTDPDPFNPGASSAQQLQVRQDSSTALYFAPIPVSDQSPTDFLDGVAPLIWVQNPNPTATTVQIGVFSRLGVTLGTATVTLPAYASTLDLRLWNALWGPYLTGAINYDDDFLVVAVADQPILGEVVMTDMFSNGASGNLTLGGRFRMGSAMMANTPALRVIDPELTFEASTAPGVETIIGIANAAPANIGPVRIEYRDRNGTLLSSSSIASFPQGAVARITPGSFGYPPSPVFDGWVRITGCTAGLLGWTMRTSGDQSQVASLGFHKVWGEALAGANGAEPGDGFNVTVGGQTWIRKVMPLVRVDPSWYWPGYTNFVNHASSNIGAYYYRFYTANGVPATGPGGGPFTGVPFAQTSFSFEDPEVSSVVVPFAANITGRVDRKAGKIQGIHVIGDPLVEWGIFNP